MAYIYATYVCEENPLSISGSASDEGISVVVDKLVGSGVLIVAQYSGGRVEGVQMKYINSDGVYTMDELTHKSGCNYRAFLWDNKILEPLCEANKF